MALGLHIGLWTSALNSGNLGPRILTSNAAPVTELSEGGDYVIQLYASDGSPLVNPQIVGGNGAFAIGDVPAAFATVNGIIGTVGGAWAYLASEGTMKGVVIANALLLPDPIEPVTVVVSATGLATKSIVVGIE